MQTWIRVLLGTPRAVASFKEHLEELVREEDTLSKVKQVDDLQFQRGKVEGIKRVLFAVTSNSNRGE